LPVVGVMLERHQVETLGTRLLAEAHAVGEALPWASGPTLDVACARLATDLGVRVTVIGPDGKVLGESTRSSESLEDHADRPEFREALGDGEGRSVRWSDTVRDRLLYAAWRQTRANEVRVVRVALPLTAVTANAAQVRQFVILGILLASLLGLGVAFVLSRAMLRRLQRLIAFSERLAAGEPTPYLGPERADELGLLEAQLGAMAARVASTIAELRIEHERLEAILRGMNEGVVVTQLDGTVVLLNARARELLALPREQDGRGRPLVELARDPALAELARVLAADDVAAPRDVTLEGGNGRTIQVNGAVLRGLDGEPFGVVLVLHDVTELRRLEVVRRDFVANVSHELRTPLTAIKGYAETLLGPAGDDRETARRFLAVIDRHSERLGRLIDDLLTLSNLELGRTSLRLAPVLVGPAIDDVLQILAARSAQSHVECSTAIAPGTPPVLADGDRLRQVLINLVDNAIKYTPAGGHVAVRAASANGRPGRAPQVEILVEDTGIGIPAQDLPRLTERFFRVDKARSRELGGTGLGLAIVKHIVQAHGGSLAIDSTLGTGTRVRVRLPAAS
jgi:two-component system phosphate regulon sensor histidine kinase PhoR